MTRFWILAALAVVALVKLANALDVIEALNINIRGQLNLFEKLKNEAENAKYADDLTKLIELTEQALKAESADKKHQILSSQPKHFSDEFNSWISPKVEEAQVNADLHEAIQYYSSLLASHAEPEAEIKKTISTLEDILKEADLKQKKEKFVSLLNENALPNANRQLQQTSKFFDNLLKDKDNKFAKEIESLKAKTEAALESSVSLEDKNKVLYEVTYTDNQELNEFLHEKNTSRPS